ncbi:Uncharacterised protein [Neisseria gonorrhoeae]|uniref:Uncharacterized protein n=1 Tax=Neisseria gonorrhoeae TaxID=485 RepID=A0A378W281_NEIGO|nr:Uncharacterised protein [Neisseria gonorrhoeae]
MMFDGQSFSVRFVWQIEVRMHTAVISAQAGIRTFQFL